MKIEMRLMNGGGGHYVQRLFELQLYDHFFIYFSNNPCNEIFALSISITNFFKKEEQTRKK